MGAACVSDNGVPWLFERLGGEQAVRVTVRIFYDKIVKDDRVNLFLNTGYKLQIDHWTRFLTVAFGGPISFSNNEIRDIHSGVNYGKYPNEDQFNAIVENLTGALKITRVPESDIVEILKVVSGLKSAILGLDDEEDEKEVRSEIRHKSKEISMKGWFKRAKCWRKSATTVQEVTINPHKDAQKDGKFTTGVEGHEGFVPVLCSRSVPLKGGVSEGPVNSPLRSPQKYMLEDSERAAKSVEGESLE